MVSHEKHFCDVVGCGKEFHGKKKLLAHKRKDHKPVFAPQVCPKQGPKNQPKIHQCGWCDYVTRYTTHHQDQVKRCPAKKRAEGLGIKEPITKDELGLLYSLTNKCSMTEFNIILDFFMQKFGKHFFEQGAKSAVSEYANSLDYLHSSEEMTFQVNFWIDLFSNFKFSVCLDFFCNSYFQDDSGNEIRRVLAYVKDTVELVNEIRRGRGVKKEQLVLSADKGVGKVVVTMGLYDADSNGKVHGLKPGSNQRIFLLAMVNYPISENLLAYSSYLQVDDIPESTNNLNIIFERLGFPLPPSKDLKFVSDLKLLLMVLGLHGTSCTHNCPFCMAHRARWDARRKKWVKTGGAGRWMSGEPRTLRNILEWYEKWMTETGGNEAKLK